MRNRSRALLAGLFFATLGLIAWLSYRPEPSYRERPLSAWLRDLGPATFEPGGFAWDDWPLSKARQNAEAAEAIRRIDSVGFPYLLNALTNRDSAWKMKMAAFLPEPLRTLTRPYATMGRRGRAVMAFDALGTQAESVTLELTQALYDYPSCKAAAVALLAVGPRGWKELTRAINSTNEWSALYAVWALAHRRATVPGTLAALKSATTNRSATVSVGAGWALGKIGQDKEHIIPFLMTALGSTNSQVRIGAMYGLGGFGTNTISAVPLLLQGLQDPEVAIRDAATMALNQIDPEAAAKAGAK